MKKIPTIFKSETYKYLSEARGTWRERNGWNEHLTVREIREMEEADEEFHVAKKRLSYLRANLVRAASRATNRHEINITLDELYEIGEDQDWCCNLSGDELEFERGGDYVNSTNKFSCTIDRIDPNKGYITGNVQLVTWMTNLMKGPLDNDEFIAYCEDVAKYCR